MGSVDGKDVGRGADSARELPDTESDVVASLSRFKGIK